MNNKYILGLNIYHADSGACLIKNGSVEFAIEEERINRIKHWDKLLEARAIENQCYTIGVNRIGLDDNGIQFNGQSKLIDMSGEIIQDLKSEECAKTITMSKSLLDSYRTKFPFLSDKDNFNILPSN